MRRISPHFELASQVYSGFTEPTNDKYVFLDLPIKNTKNQMKYSLFKALIDSGYSQCLLLFKNQADALQLDLEDGEKVPIEMANNEISYMFRYRDVSLEAYMPVCENLENPIFFKNRRTTLALVDIIPKNTKRISEVTVGNKFLELMGFNIGLNNETTQPALTKCLEGKIFDFNELTPMSYSEVSKLEIYKHIK